MVALQNVANTFEGCFAEQIGDLSSYLKFTFTQQNFNNLIKSCVQDEILDHSSEKSGFFEQKSRSK